MKNAITLFFVFACLTSSAQYRGAENNYYTFSEKDSISTTTNFVGTVFKNGTVLYWPYGGQLQLLGNNYTSKAPAPLDEIIPHPGFYRVDNTAIWLSQANKAYLLNNEQIIDSLSSKGEIYLMASAVKPEPILWFIYKKEDRYLVASYADEKVKEWGEPPFKLDINHTLWKNEKGNVLVGKANEYCELAANGFGPVKKFLLPANSYYILNAAQPLASLLAKTFETNPRLLRINKNTVQQIHTSSPIKDISSLNDEHTVINRTNNDKEIIRFTDSSEITVTKFHNDDTYSSVTKASEGSFYLGGLNKLIRTFSYIKKYPNLFEGNSSASIFSIQQGQDGDIWAGSYRGYLSRITKQGLQPVQTNNIHITNGGCVINDKVYLVGEEQNNGLLQFNKNGQYRKITKNVTGFITYTDSSNGLLYFGAEDKGLWYTSISTLTDKEVKWKIVSQKQGVGLPNIVTITKDKKGRIWLGQPSRGWAIYYPQQNKAITHLIEKNETDFGLMSSYTDDRGTVWLGSKQKGLLYFNNYNTDSVVATDIKSIVHPLLQNSKTITAIKQWGNWLIFGATDYYLALDLNAWYQSKKVLIRYLNPQEAAFTGTTEQNTLLVDKRDSSIWFSTTDMLYQWDFKQWLSLPIYSVLPTVEIVLNGRNFELKENRTITFKPVENNLDFSVWFQSPDNMPRYMSVALTKKGDSLLFPSPGLQTHFNYSNLAPGKYILAIQICQSDGSASIHQFHITIKNFWWQLWWIWALAFTTLASVLIYILNIRRKKKLAEETFKTKAAELETIKAKQQKELANLQVVALSSQFRPHFILNALNTIGAQMDDKPEAEAVLSRLGESINIIFNHAQQQNIAHSFADEWKLVTNIIHIHQLMYLKKLETILPTDEQIKQLGTLNVPLGVFQIPVENALLHGLSNKESGPWLLHIIAKTEINNVVITISDNGVGRTNAATLSNYRKHGTGSKNIAGILAIINEGQEQKITVNYKDEYFVEDKNSTGTTVIITIPKQFTYER